MVISGIAFSLFMFLMVQIPFHIYQYIFIYYSVFLHLNNMLAVAKLRFSFINISHPITLRFESLCVQNKTRCNIT